MTRTPVLVRPYERADAHRVRAMSARLSQRTLYERFFTGTPTLPPMYYAALTRVDHHDREALLAVDGDAVVGIAEYARDNDTPERADLAVIVADGWQHRGVARVLVTDLASLAATRGIANFTVEVLANNRPALAASAWPQANPHYDGTTTRFTLPLTELPGVHDRVDTVDDPGTSCDAGEPLAPGHDDRRRRAHSRSRSG